MAATPEATILRLDDGRLLCFAELGDPAGTPVFGFHGTPGSRLIARPFDAQAGRLGIRLIAPDRPGYGHSDYLPGRRLIDWPRDVVAIADALGIQRFGVFGVSGGGPHAAVCAHELGARLLGAAIVSDIAPTLTAEDARGMMPTHRLFSSLARRSQYLVWPLFALLGFAMRHSGSAPSAGSRECSPDPVHVFHGELDVNVPVAHGRLQADRIPNAKLHYFPDQAHLLCVPHAESVLRCAAGLDPGVAGARPR